MRPVAVYDISQTDPDEDADPARGHAHSHAHQREPGRAPGAAGDVHRDARAHRQDRPVRQRGGLAARDHARGRRGHGRRRRGRQADRGGVGGVHRGRCGRPHHRPALSERPRRLGVPRGGTRPRRCSRPGRQPWTSPAQSSTGSSPTRTPTRPCDSACPQPRPGNTTFPGRGPHRSHPNPWEGPHMTTVTTTVSLRCESDVEAVGARPDRRLSECGRAGPWRHTGGIRRASLPEE
jgi:hypothetical protein